MEEKSFSMKTLFLIYILTSFGEVSPLSRDPDSPYFPAVSGDENLLVLNEFIDSIIREMKTRQQLIEVLNPLTLERNITFSKGVIYQISVNGLLSLHRVGDITFVPDTPEVIAKLAVKDVDLKFKYNVRALGVPSQGRLNMRVNNIEMGLRASFRGAKASLDQFEIHTFGKILIREFAGTSRLLNWLTKPTLELALNLSRSKLKEKIEKALRERLEEEFRRIHLEDVIASVILQ
ncbi:uncharacterized protein LOC100897793 [Galendromus occidentalis]|uniref:Uncharacterized protein LOC100897793 n=1 Tax=Galendromus occidentalis TaxID=34638 RepID=A0AAJ6QXY8_9ACAR|nr:uncharacterized protein LOC100897793 [Galendromus occidentalis]